MAADRWSALRRPEMGTYIAIWGALAALAGVAIAAEGAYEVWRDGELNRWPVAQGAVLRVDDVKDRSVEGAPAGSRVATYAFVLDGNRIVARQSLAIPNAEWLRTARTPALLQMQPGACLVHYNPANPADSWIRRDPPLWEAIPLGLSFGLMGLVSGLIGWKMRRDNGRLAGAQRGIDSLPHDPPGPKRWEVGCVGLA